MSVNNYKSVMEILKQTNDDKTLKDQITLFDNFEFPNDMRVTSNLLEMHPQILKDKLRISKFIHRYFNPSLYERNQMKAIKTIMKLDHTQVNEEKSTLCKEGMVSLYEPYNKVVTDLQLMKENRKRGKKRPDRSVHIQRTEPLAKLILNDFENNFQKEELFVNNYKNLMIKNKVIDVMDDYYSRHISKEGGKPEHLFMFKAKPLIPPGRILLNIEREYDKDKTKGHKYKMKVGNSEISMYSPVRGDRKFFNVDESEVMNKSTTQQSPQGLDFTSALKQTPKPSEISKPIENKDINDVYGYIDVKKSIDRTMQHKTSKANMIKGTFLFITSYLIFGILIKF